MPFPFTVSADLDLGARVTAASVDRDADVTVREGEVPATLGAESGELRYQLKPGEFLLNAPDGSRHYVKDGRTIIYSRGENSDDSDLTLFLLGSAWGALCYQRGLIPIHASGNVVGGRVFAFTGHSGAGKSTLAANLAKRGHDFFTDDTLIFDPSASGPDALCYAGQKQLKLWGDAVRKTGAEALQPVRANADMDKHYAAPPSPSAVTVAPFSRLYVLRRTQPDAAAPNTAEKLSGSEALQAFRRNLFRPQYAEILMGRKPLFIGLKALFESVEVYDFTREFGPENYDPAVDFIEDHIAGAGKGIA
ncbi:hypothetical protein [Erythrobacter sp. MTPC3]|uniref:hypothetical protein n=1 Tax=Erythrobacter sp. MTPC3 TaxID=3056564 RepID=UPI0036F34EB5